MNNRHPNWINSRNNFSITTRQIIFQTSENMISLVISFSNSALFISHFWFCLNLIWSGRALVVSCSIPVIMLFVSWTVFYEFASITNENYHQVKCGSVFKILQLQQLFISNKDMFSTTTDVMINICMLYSQGD